MHTFCAKDCMFVHLSISDCLCVIPFRKLVRYCGGKILQSDAKMLDKQLGDKLLETGICQIYTKLHQLNNIKLVLPPHTLTPVRGSAENLKLHKVFLFLCVN